MEPVVANDDPHPPLRTVDGSFGGHRVDLVEVDDEGDDLDEAERAALNAAIAKAWDSVRAGQGRSASDVISSLRK